MCGFLIAGSQIIWQVNLVCFVKLDESMRSQVKFGDDKEVDVIKKVRLQSKLGKEKLLIMVAPCMCQNYRIILWVLESL